MLNLQLKVNHAKLQSAIERLGRGLNDWSGAWPTVAEAVRSMAGAQFESQGASGASGGWAPLSREYAARKAKTYPGKPLMRATDRLYDSVTGISPDTIFDPSANRLTLGTRVPYAALSQSRSPGSKQRQREIYDSSWGLSNPNTRALIEPLHRFACRLAQEAGFGA